MAESELTPTPEPTPSVAEPQLPPGDKKPDFIDMVIAQCPIVKGSKVQTSGGGDAFRNYLKRIGKSEAFQKIKKHMQNNMGMPAANAWVSSAMRFGWFELWTEEKAANGLNAQIASGELRGHELFTLPRDQWQAFVKNNNMLKLPNPLPYIPPPGRDGVIPQGKAERIEANRAIQKELSQSSDPLGDLNWAWNNLCRDGLRLDDCPSGSAFNMYLMGKERRAELFDMYSKAFITPLLKRDPEKDRRDAELNSDKKRSMSLIDALVASLGE